MRVLIVLLAYACAALMAPLLLLAYGMASEGIAENATIGETLFVASLLSTVAAVYALPVAVPVIAFTEWRRRGDWQIFLVAGVVLGAIIALLFAEVPMNAAHLIDAIPFAVLALACVMTYWAVAWKWLGPRAPIKAAA